MKAQIKYSEVSLVNRTELLVSKIIRYLKNSKPIDLWAKEIAELERGKYSGVIMRILDTYAEGPLFDYACELLQTLDKVDR